MSKVKTTLGWVGIVLLGLVMGILEDLLFFRVMVPNFPPSWDLTGDLFFIFTVPLAQLLALAVTGTIGWFFLGLRQLPRLVVFWICWSVSRAMFLNQFHNPIEDIAIYLVWIAFWCALIGLLARVLNTRATG